MQVDIEPGLRLKLGIARLAGCRNDADRTGLDAQWDVATRAAAARLGRRPLAEEPAIAGVRRLFRACGMDPGRYRPAGEALARRVAKGQPLPRINPLVDINNLCSLESLLPCGSYDRRRIDGDVSVRLGRPGEGYQGIARPVDVAGKLACADRAGPFGSPIADAARTMITADSRDVLLIVYAPVDCPDDAITATLDRYAALAVTHTGARVEAAGVRRGDGAG